MSGRKINHALDDRADRLRLKENPRRPQRNGSCQIAIAPPLTDIERFEVERAMRCSNINIKHKQRLRS